MRVCPDPSVLQVWGPAVLAAVLAVVGGWIGGYHVMRRQVERQAAAEDRRDQTRRIRDWFDPSK